jgi:hypothetical protein
MVTGGNWLSARTLVPLVIPPLYIAIVSLVERRWGPSWSGRMTAIPTQTTTVILLVALVDGIDPAAAVSGGAILGVISLSSFAIVYGLASNRYGWLPSVALAVTAFLLSGLLMLYVHGPDVLDAIVAVGIVLGVAYGLRRIRSPLHEGRRAAIGLPVRMGLATALVLFVALSVPLFGPVAAGTLGVFPIITAPMTVLNHRESGPGASRRYLEGLEWGLIGGVVFFLVLSSLLASRGLGVAFLVGVPLLVATLAACFILPHRFLAEPEHGEPRAEPGS